MKFLIFALAVFGVAQTTEIQPNSFKEALNKIEDFNEIKKFIGIMQSCNTDPEVKLTVENLRNKLPAVVEILRNDAEFQAFFSNSNDLESFLEWLNHLIELLNVNSSNPKLCGGWRGVYEQVKQEVNLAELKVVFSQVRNDYPEFAIVWDRMRSGIAIIQRLATVMDGLGIDLELITDFLGIFDITVEI